MLPQLDGIRSTSKLGALRRRARRAMLRLITLHALVLLLALVCLGSRLHLIFKEFALVSS